jgi:hypothetical protein
VSGFHFTPATPGTNYPNVSIKTAMGCDCQCKAVTAVGQVAQDQITDAQREFLIRRAGRMMRLAMARYERSGCFSDRGLADYWLLTMRSDIRARSPEQVARMEAARGLA